MPLGSSRLPFLSSPDQSERARLADLFAECFRTDAEYRWCFPDPGSQTELCRRYFRVLLDTEAETGLLAYTDAEHQVAFAMKPPGRRPFTGMREQEYGRRYFDELGAECAAKVLSVQEGVLRSYATDLPPHFYVLLVGVHPRARTSPAPAAALAALTRARRTENCGFYGMAGSPRNVMLYELVGARPIGEPITVSGGLVKYPMWLPPPS